MIDLDSKKLIAAVVVAMFCVTAYAVIDTGDASDAASKKYELYVEILGDDHTVKDYAFVYFESEADNEKYCEAANSALSKAGYGDVKLALSEYGISVTYKDDFNSSTWYSNGDVWVPVSKTESDYIDNAKSGLAVNGGWIDQETYDDLPAYEQSNWASDSAMPGYYQKVVEAPAKVGEIKDYFVYLTVVANDLVSIEVQSIEFKAENNYAAWVFAFNQATKALGNSIFAKVNAAYFDGYIMISYGENANTASWVKESKKWVSVSDSVKQYTSGNTLDFELQNGWITEAQYKGLPESEQAFWVKDSSGMGDYYQRMASGELVDDVLDFVLIAGIIFLVVVVVIVVVIIVIAKKKKSA